MCERKERETNAAAGRERERERKRGVFLQNPRAREEEGEVPLVFDFFLLFSGIFFFEISS